MGKAVGPFFGDKAADALTEGDCQSYAALRRAKGRSDGTIWTELGHLRSALKWVEKENLISRCAGNRLPRAPTAARQATHPRRGQAVP